MPKAVARGFDRGRAAAHASDIGNGHALAEEGMTMVGVTHEIGFPRRVGTRLNFIGRRRIAADGAPAGAIDPPPKRRLLHFLRPME